MKCSYLEDVGSIRLTVRDLGENAPDTDIEYIESGSPANSNKCTAGRNYIPDEEDQENLCNTENFSRCTRFKQKLQASSKMNCGCMRKVLDPETKVIIAYSCKAGGPYSPDEEDKKNLCNTGNFSKCTRFKQHLQEKERFKDFKIPAKTIPRYP